VTCCIYNQKWLLNGSGYLIEEVLCHSLITHEETLETFLSNNDAVVDTLDLLASDSDPDTSDKAASFRASVLNFSFIMCLTVVRHYLACTKPVSLAFRVLGVIEMECMNQKCF